MGELQWNYTWAGTADDWVNDLALDSSDNLYLAGYTKSFGALGNDICLLKYNPTGSLQWNYTWGTAGHDYSYAIGLDSSENIYLAGEIDTGLYTDVYIVKFENSLPVITIYSPIQDIFIGSIAPNYNISIIVTFLHTSWYTLDDGMTNIIFSGFTGTINQTEWDKKGDGLVTLRFYANNSMGRIGTSEMSFYKDTEPPSSSIFFMPHSGINIVNDSTTFTLTADDGLGSGVAIIKYKIKYGTTYDSGWIDYIAPFDLSSYDSGDYLISYYSIDMIGNTENATTISVELIKITSAPPEIPGYNILLLISIICVVSIISLKFKYKLVKF